MKFVKEVREIRNINDSYRLIGHVLQFDDGEGTMDLICLDYNVPAVPKGWYYFDGTRIKHQTAKELYRLMAKHTFKGVVDED